MADSKKEKRPRQHGPGTNKPPSYTQEALSLPRQKSAQAETSVTDVSRNAARGGEQPYTVWSSERAFILSTAAAGRRAQGSTIASFGNISRGLVVIGLAVVMLTLVIDSYYFVVTGWTLGYAVEATLGNLPDFEAFTSGYASVVYFLITCMLVTAVLFFGVSSHGCGS